MSATHPRKPSNMVAERHDLCDEVECLKGDLAETKTSLPADETLAAAIHETINLLNDDDALEHFKANAAEPLFGAGPAKHRCGGQTSDG